MTTPCTHSAELDDAAVATEEEHQPFQSDSDGTHVRATSKTSSTTTRKSATIAASERQNLRTGLAAYETVVRTHAKEASNEAENGPRHGVSAPIQERNGRRPSRVQHLWARAKQCVAAEIAARTVSERLRVHVIPLLDAAMKDLGNRLRDRLPTLRESEAYADFVQKEFGLSAVQGT